MTMTPDPMRATAERLAREVVKNANADEFRPWTAWEDMHPVAQQQFVDLALAGLTHRDRTAEREAAEKAWDAAVRFMVPVGNETWRECQSQRDRYLAREFDAGKRTECERCGGLMPAHERQYAHHQELAACVDFLADAVKRLAEQRGAER